MLIRVKTIKNESFEVEVNPAGNIFSLKEAISYVQEAPPECQKIIYLGKILKDEQLLEDLKIKPTDFVVLMTTKKPTSATKQQISEPKSQFVPISDEEFSKNLDEWSKKMYEKGKAANSFEEYKFESPNKDLQEKSELSTEESGGDEMISKSIFELVSYELITMIETKKVSFMELVENPLLPLIREAVQKSPEIFESMLNQISKKSPEVYEVISKNKQEFLDLLMKDD